MNDNGSLVSKVQENLALDPLTAGSHIDVEAKDDQIHLHGTVASEDAIVAAEDAARSAGAAEIRNGLVVVTQNLQDRETGEAPAGVFIPPLGDQGNATGAAYAGYTTYPGTNIPPLIPGLLVPAGGGRADDSDIADAVQATFAADGRFAEAEVDVVVDDGIVTLTGTAPSEQMREEITHSALRTVGVRGIQNLLKVPAS